MTGPCAERTMSILLFLVCTPEVRTSPDPSSENIPAMGRVKPNRTVAAAVIMAPPIINGRRLPNLDFELSARTPTLYNLSVGRSDGETADCTDDWLNDETR